MLCNFSIRRDQYGRPQHCELHSLYFKYIIKHYFIFLIFTCQSQSLSVLTLLANKITLYFQESLVKRSFCLEATVIKIHKQQFSLTEKMFHSRQPLSIFIQNHILIKNAYSSALQLIAFLVFKTRSSTCQLIQLDDLFILLRCLYLLFCGEFAVYQHKFHIVVYHCHLQRQFK